MSTSRVRLFLFEIHIIGALHNITEFKIVRRITLPVRLLVEGTLTEIQRTSHLKYISSGSKGIRKVGLLFLFFSVFCSVGLASFVVLWAV